MKSLIKKVAVSSLLTLSAITNSFADDCLSGNCYALVINNYDYNVGKKLVKTKDDGDDVKKQLQSVGFHVRHVPNVRTKQEFDIELDAFVTAAKNEAKKSENTFALVYYSGHGILEGKQAFLLPTDLNNLQTKFSADQTEKGRAAAFEENAMSMNDLLAKLEDLTKPDSSTKLQKFQGVLLIIDACQNELTLENTTVAENTANTLVAGNTANGVNKQLVLKEIVRGLQIGTGNDGDISLKVPDGFVTIFAAKPSTVSKDTLKGVDLKNSLYTSQLLEFIGKEESISFLELVGKVERNVMDISKDAGEIQKPYMVGITSAFSNFYFNPPQEFEPYTPKKY